MKGIDHVVVVVPAHDEEELIGQALEALGRAADEVADRVQVTLVVVANGCTDRTAQVARAAGAAVVEVPAANVGAARASGFAWALATGAGRLERWWFATTDADSQVPADWIVAQLETAATGGDVHLGTVSLAADDRLRFTVWSSAYAALRHDGGGHAHVHGASLGLRASAYVKVGGFRALDHSEDLDLVTRLAADGARIVRDDGGPVVTSARLVARAPGGVAQDLARSLSLPSGSDVPDVPHCRS